MPQKIQGSQTDFSFGEVDVALKRADGHPARKGGLRQMKNARIINAGGVQDRPGRRALYPISNSGTRTESIAMSSGNNFHIQFAAGRVQIINFATGANLANFTTQGNGGALPWASAADIQSIVYTIFNLTITITFGHSMRPQVLTWDGVSTWTIADYTEAILGIGQKRTPFYRISPQNITMLPSATTGNITLNFSSPIVVAGMVGTRMRFCNRQLLLGAVIDTSNIHATVIEPLPPGAVLTLGPSHGNFAIGDVVDGSLSGAQGIVTSSPTSQAISSFFFGGQMQIGDAVTGGTSGATGVVTGFLSSGIPGVQGGITVSLTTSTAFMATETITGPHGSIPASAVSPVNMVVQMLQNDSNSMLLFQASENIAGPSGSAGIASSGTPVAITTPQAVAVWDDEIMNSLHGFPGACFSDQFRVGFCDFPSLPGGIAWSAINSASDLYANDASSPDNAIFEIAPGKTRVYYVVPGPESNEFIFCDTKIYYIPISPTNPLKPGSVQFLILSGDGSAQVQPRLAQEGILYVNAGQNSVMAVIATGAYLRPFNTKNLCEFHAHLFNNIQCIAAPNADGTFNERYAYVLNGDGSIAVGKYSPESLATSAPVIGWGPWSGNGVVTWIAARAADVIFTSSYFGNLVVEVLDDTQYLDCAINVNSPPSAFVSGGHGSLYLVRNAPTFRLMDQVTRDMGAYQVDALGNIIPQFNGGENLAIASLVAGQPWTLTVEPFAPDAQPGADVHQRMTMRQIASFAAWVVNSSGFKFASLFSSKQTPTSPALGTVTNTRVVPAYNLGDDTTKPPLLRETVETFAPQGSTFDPRVAIIKDAPGPLQILEFGMEITL